MFLFSVYSPLFLQFQTSILSDLSCVASNNTSSFLLSRGFERWSERERERGGWPCRRGNVSSFCHWVLLQLICSLILSLSFTLLSAQWTSTTEPLFSPLHVQSVCLCCVGALAWLAHSTLFFVLLNCIECILLVNREHYDSFLDLKCVSVLLWSKAVACGLWPSVMLMIFSVSLCFYFDN